MTSMSERAYALVEYALFRNAPKSYRRLYTLYKRWTDRGEWRWFQSILRPGMVVADVGSNIGVYTELFARLVGPAGLVHSFEPDPENFARQVAACSGLANIRFNQAAVGPASGRLRLFRSPHLNVDHQTFDSGDNRAVLEVSAIALDDYFPPGSSVDMIKIDIQGFELEALRGMKRLLRENERIALLLEYSPRGLEAAGGSGVTLRGELRELGFALASLSGTGTLHALGDAEPALGTAGYTNIVACRRLPDGPQP